MRKASFRDSQNVIREGWVNKKSTSFEGALWRYAHECADKTLFLTIKEEYVPEQLRRSAAVTQ